ncbi:hypothetical protein ABB37_09386 [Leptomonas pyrrhocoris]|uniref:Fibronectin type-III domain-containing protein n=1 Tax=Leptomonas pyrrhocoris TaxID=157538 RepID=A0A0M9FQM0_LEPPY|nr:hypothetical protein ABB37_09386 [Leptomonas pyrrhocoris]KPA74090.1 hypothetical protein ABB37_09386 [Leptomonas pyrrhocoris]|eukprot:XP_015652529.1 hypothetical protein ABB37_09386 [Leptomonas pyrrhocoris]
MAVEGGTEVRQVDGAVSGYEVRVLDADANVAATTTTTFRDAGITLSGLQLSSFYSIQVRAKDTYDAWGLWSDPVPFYTLKPVTVGLQRVGENFAAVHWSRHTPLSARLHSTDLEDGSLAATAHPVGEATEGMYADDGGVLHPDERVTRWHVRVSCNRVFAGMPQSEDYRELYVGEGESALQVDGLLPHATYSIAVRGLNHAGEWGHWSPSLYVSTCPLLKVGVEMAGETFLQVAWKRPAARTGVTEWAAPQEVAGGRGRERSPPVSASAGLSLPASESVSNTRPLVSSVNSPSGSGGEEDGGQDGSLSGSFSSSVAESYQCFPSDSEVHNYQVTIRPMPMEPAFDESDEPLVDGARVYETTQPGLLLGNLLSGCRYAVTVREQQISEDGRPIAGVWGAASEMVCTQTVPPVHVIPQEIGEDYCLVEWRRAAEADTPEDSVKAGGTSGNSKDAKSGSPMTTVLAATTTIGRKAVEFQLQTRRLNPDGVTLYEGPLSLDSVVSVPSSVNTYHISSLVPSSVYEVRVRAKMEGGQWGIWSLATRFLTQSRLELRVDMVQEVAMRLSWSRARASVMPSSENEQADENDAGKPLSFAQTESETVSDGVAKNARPSTVAAPEIAVAAHVVLPNEAVHEYEVVLEGISCEHHRRLTFGQDMQMVMVEDLQQDQLYCVSVRSLSEQQHWSYFSPKVSVLTLASVQVRVSQYTEATALLEWYRPLPNIARFSDLLSRQEREVLQQCDERERRELFEMKRKLQEQESKGEQNGAARWLDSAAREEKNTMLREEATLHYQMDRIVVGIADSSGYELRLTLQDGSVCLPFIKEVERLRLRPSKTSRFGSNRDLLSTTRRLAGGTSATRGFLNPVIGGSGSARDRKKEAVLKVSYPPAGQSVTLSNNGASPSSTGTSAPVGAGAPDAAVELLDVQLQPSVTQVLLQGLSPNSTFVVTVRGRSGPETWQPWSPPTQLETLAPILLDQSRFGEHYINLYWYREEATAMAATVQETEEYRRLQREFHNFTERDLETQRGQLSAAEYTSLVGRVRRLRALRRLAADRARRHAAGELGLLTDLNCPIRGFQLRVVDEAGTVSEHYLPNDAAKPMLSYTETGLQPNNMYVCRLCPHYGDDVWGCWTAPLKYMTHNLIQLDLTYISETFVDLEWWRLDNKEVAKMDVHDTLLSSRYTEEVQVYQLRITHEDAQTNEEVEEFRDMQATNVLRIDALLPDMKYTIAVREWDAKGDWGLWSAPCSCVTLPSIETVVTEVKECSAYVSWSRTAPRIDYESDMHVLEGNVEITGFYLRLEEIPVHGRAVADAADGTRRDSGMPSNPPDSDDGSFSDLDESAGALSMDLDTARLNTSFHGVPTVATEERPRMVEVDELEGTLAFGFQRGGPLPPDPHPVLCDGMVPNNADKSATSSTSSSKARQHYLMVKRIASSTELEAALARLNPQTIYCVQVMAETTGGQVGPWSSPHHFITMPRIRLSPATIYEHYATLQWGRVTLTPLANLVTSSNNHHSDQRSSWSAVDIARRKVTLPTSKVVAYELEVVGQGCELVLSTRFETNSPTSNFRVTGLALDSLYTARVRSFNEAGEASLWSTERKFVTLKRLLVHPKEIAENHIDAEWGRPEQNPESYRAKIAARADKEELVGASASMKFTNPAPGTTAFTAPGGHENASADSEFSMHGTHMSTESATNTGTAAAGSPHVPSVSVGARDAVKYHVRVYHATEDVPPELFLEKHLSGSSMSLTVSSLDPNSIYLLYVRAVNHDGVWSEWSEGRCVYTMKPLVSSVATVGEDFVRLQWSREAPEELHYAPHPESVHDKNSGAREAAASTSAKERNNDGELTEGGGGNSGQESGPPPQEYRDDDVLLQPTRSDGAVAAALASESPMGSPSWQRRRRFVVLDKPAGDAGPVYHSAATSILSYVISVRRSEEAEDYTVEVPGDVHQYTLPALQPDCIYLVSVRAKYGSGEWSPWSDPVRTGTYNLLATDVKEVGEDYFSAAWQRKANTIHMGSLRLGKVEETVCYEVRVRDYSDIPLGEEEGELARQRVPEGRSLFLHPNQRHCVMRELQANHRYRLTVRRWYQPHDGFAQSSDGDADESAASGDSAKVTIDPALHEAMEKAKAAPGVWSEAEYVVTLRGMVCTVERVGEEFFQLRWARDPRAIPLAVRRAMPVKPVQTYQLRIDEMLRDGSAVESTRSSNTLHLDELMPPTETSYFNKFLKPNTLYKIEVRCCIEKAWGRWSRPVYVITLPCLQIELSRIGEVCATITWQRPREPLTLPDGEVAVLGDEEDADGTYQLEVSGVGFSYQVSKRFKASRSSYTVKHLDADALYSARVRWGDSVNQAWSLWSETTCFATLKALQVQLSMPTEHFVNVEWSRPKQTAEEYVTRVEKQQKGAALSSAPSPLPPPPSGASESTAGATAEQTEAEQTDKGVSLVSPLATAIQLGNPGSLAFHLCVFNTQETPSVAVVDKQFHKDVSQYRVSGLNADTPYVVIIRACCEATGDWGLWSDEHPFRTLKLLAPTVSGVGENYAELTWEQGDGTGQLRTTEATGAANSGGPVMPTKFLMVLRSTHFGTVEREITREECGASQGVYPVAHYRLAQLHPGTEYAVALQPYYGDTADWGLWSQAVLFTTLHTLQITATVRGDAADLCWSRRGAPGGWETAVRVVDGAPPDVVSGTDFGAPRSPLSICPPSVGGVINSVAPLVSTRTVSRYQLAMYRESDWAILRQQHASLEMSTSTASYSSRSLSLAVAAEQQLHSGQTSPSASPVKGGSRHAAKLGELRSPNSPSKLLNSPLRRGQRGSRDVAVAQSQTAIPDMDMAAVANLESTGAATGHPSFFLFRKTYDLNDTNTAATNTPPSSVNTSGAGSCTNPNCVTEHVEGLTPDTVYIVRLRAMDLGGHWGASVEQRIVTPPLPPSQVVLRRVNTQFCSLQWAPPPLTAKTTPLPGETSANNVTGGASGVLSAASDALAARYRYVIEQCFVGTDAAATANASSAGPSSAPANAAAAGRGGSTGASRRGAGGGGTGGPGGPGGAGVPTIGTVGPEWRVVDTVEDTLVCAVRISGLLTRMRCRVKCARRHTAPAPALTSVDGDTGETVVPPRLSTFLGPYSDFSEVVTVSSGTPPEGVQDLHLTSLSRNAATLEWLPPPKPSEAAAGRYTRPHYRVYLANTTDQPYPMLLATVHRPTYPLTNLTPGTAYTVQVVAENNDGVSFNNLILLFHTKAEDDTTVARYEESKSKEAAAAAAPLGEIVPFHGPRALQQTEEDGAFVGADVFDDVAEIPTASRRLMGGPSPPSLMPQRRGRGSRDGAAGRIRGSLKKESEGAAATARPSTSPQRKHSRKRSSSAKGKSKAKREKGSASATHRTASKHKKAMAITASPPEPVPLAKEQGTRLPPLSRTM